MSKSTQSGAPETPSKDECLSTASGCPVCPVETPATLHAQGPDFEYSTTGSTEWFFYSCDACGTIFLDPRPDTTELSRIYPSNYYAYDFTVKQTIGYRVKTLLDQRTAQGYLESCPRSGNILDIGCGDGRLLQALAGLGVQPERLYGCDLDETAISRGRASGLNLQLSRFEEADLPEGSFALIVLQQVIEHVPDPGAVIQRITELLMPGGIVILETPNVRSLDHALFSGRHWGGYHIPRHFFLFSGDSLARLLRKNGLEVRETTALLSPMFWVQSVHHVLAENSLLSPLRRLFDPMRPNALALATFSLVDTVSKPSGWTSNMRVVGCKPKFARQEPESEDLRSTFREEGWLVLKGKFNPERITACRESFEAHWEAGQNVSVRDDGDGGDALIKLHQLEGRHPAFKSIANDPDLRAVVEDLIGPVEVFRDVCVAKPPGSTCELGYHQDAAYWDTKPDRLLSAWIALDDVPVASGCLRVIPGSHHAVFPHDLWLGSRRLPRPVTQLLRRAVSLTGTGDNPTTASERAFFRAKQLALGPLARLLPGVEELNDLHLDQGRLPPTRPVEIPVKAGDVILFHGLLLHGSGPNTGETWRRGYIVSFAGI